MDKSRSQAQHILECKRASADWIDSNFYDEWKQVWKSFHCERDPAKDDDGKDDPTQSSIGSPLTFSHVQQTVARGTAQIPNIKFHARDNEIGDLISRTLMYNWDRGGTQRQQKKHYRQTVLFGWSVRAWHFAIEDYTRTRRVNAMDPNIDPETLKLVASTYKLDGFAANAVMGIPHLRAVILARLTAKHGRGSKLLPVKYDYTAYQGPKSDVLFIGDCYPERDFESLQTAGYFIVERRRDKEWLERTARDIPEFREGIGQLLRDKPNGNPRQHFGTDKDSRDLRGLLAAAINQSSDNREDAPEDTGTKWTITEMWEPGRTPKVSLAGEDDIFLGKMDSPYDLEGRIPFTDAVLIDNLLSGMGNSAARIMRGMQQMHERQMNTRFDLVDNIARPLIGTNDRNLYENPELVKRGKGFRMFYTQGPNSIWVNGEQAAMAATAVALQDESSLMRLWQTGVGASNLSMGANVDPQQNRTATGAKIGAMTLDVLTKDLTDMFTETSVKEDAFMMYLLNRSELSEAYDFEGGRYDRIYDASRQEVMERWLKVEPAMFQLDGEITVEQGSTLADDDESKVTQATNLYSMFAGNPGVNQDKLRDTVLIAHGKGRELKEWAAPAPTPPPPEEKFNISLALKWENLSIEEKNVLRPKMGLPINGGGPPQPGGDQPPTPPGSDQMLAEEPPLTQEIQ